MRRIRLIVLITSKHGVPNSSHGTAFVVSGGLFFSCKKRSGLNVDVQLKNRFISAFERFETVWNFKDFWKRGNTHRVTITSGI